MNRIYTFLLLLITGTFIVSCDPSAKPVKTQHTYNALQKADWFLGRWENVSEDGVLSETWKRETDSTFVGESYFVAGDDTVFTEHIRLEEIKGKLFYVPTVADQNGGKPVRFALTSWAGNELVFENPKHDFPQQITYTLRNDSLIAKISGSQNGKPHYEEFPMARVSKLAPQETSGAQAGE